MAPEVAGSIPVSHPGSSDPRGGAGPLRGLWYRDRPPGVRRTVAQLVEHRSPKPGVGGSIPSGPARNAIRYPPAVNDRGTEWRAFEFARTEDRGQRIAYWALSSRGLGRGPLKAQTRVRIPLALLKCGTFEPGSTGVPAPSSIGLGRDPFKVERRVRFPLGLWETGASSSTGRAADS